MYNWYRFPEDIFKAPTSEGVYLLSESDSEEGIVYVGRADDLRKRLSEHPDPVNPCLQRKNIEYFTFEEDSNSEEREEELKEKYGPPCNRT